MPNIVRRSLLVQLVSVYLLFVLVVLVAGVVVNAAVEQHLRNEVQASDQVLAQDIALETSDKLISVETSLARLSTLALLAGSHQGMVSVFQSFMTTRSDVDHVYWLDSVGDLKISVSAPQSHQPLLPSTALPTEDQLPVTPPEFSPPTVVQQALTSPDPVFEVGIAQESTKAAGVMIAYARRVVPGEPRSPVIGILVVSLSLDQLASSLQSIAGPQQSQGKLLITVINDQGELIASSDKGIQSAQYLYVVLNQYPGADQALRGLSDSRVAPGPGNQDWLYSSVPVSSAGWAVVVQRPASDALAIVAQFHLWLLLAALIFAVGGLVFWWMLLRRVIRPLHALAVQHDVQPAAAQALLPHAPALAGRADEVGGLARSLERLEHDVLTQLAELRTLLETSTAVVGSLDPTAVVGTIIQEAGKLVDVQAAAVLVPDERGVLRVLVSDGHTERYRQALSLSPENVDSAAVTALREQRPVQKTYDSAEPHPSLSAQEGFRAVLAIPIISRHAGAVVLLVHRTEPQPFSDNEVDLLLTFANYATLAWEHAVLYERSDERLREVARENERLYRASSEERQRLAAIMGSLRDGLVLAGVDGAILYANPGASAIAGLSSADLEHSDMPALTAALCAASPDPAACARALADLEVVTAAEVVIELQREGRRRAIHVRPFDVSDESGSVVGRGLLLRDVTREREMDEFKSTLLAAVGHELRTPLAAIKGHASTLLQDDVTWPLDDQRHFLQTISGEADRLALLVSNLLDLSRQEAGLLLLNRAPAQMREMVLQAVAQVSHPGVDISLHAPDDLPPLKVDRARIEVVLRNLLTNAVTYGDGEVYVSAERRDDNVVVSVSDNGPGLAPDELPHAFERFYRARHGLRQRSGGTGLGLAICKAFVEAHGGAIWAESDGAHTTISFSLPIAVPSESPAPAAETEMAPLFQAGAERSSQ